MKLNKLNSKENAFNRIRKLAARMKREPKRREGIVKQMNEIINQNHARRVETQGGGDVETPEHIPLHAIARTPPARKKTRQMALLP